MNKQRINEKELKPASGYPVLFILIAAIIASAVLTVYGAVHLETEVSVLYAADVIIGLALLCLLPILAAGLKTVQPNEALVLTLFGKYYGTIKTSGFFFVNPFTTAFSPAYNSAKADAAERVKQAAAEGKTVMAKTSVKKSISLKTQTLNNPKQKVNDSLGNPIIIGAIVIWHVADPTAAVFSVENYVEFLNTQTDSVIRNACRLYPYDVFNDDDDDDLVRELTLRGSSIEIAESMKSALAERVQSAGLTIEEVRITHLAYAEEIAAAMLQRQQAVAIIAARKKIVDGAVGMVKMAIEKLGEEDVVVLDEERKAQMVSNLLVVRCGNHDAQPIVNSGSIY